SGLVRQPLAVATLQGNAPDLIDHLIIELDQVQRIGGKPLQLVGRDWAVVAHNLVAVAFDDPGLARAFTPMEGDVRHTSLLSVLPHAVCSSLAPLSARIARFWPDCAIVMVL